MPPPQRCALQRAKSFSASDVAPVPLNNAGKRALKARAQRLEPMVKLGHAGVSDGFLRSMDAALAQHGLVKMKFTDFKEQKHELAPEIAAKTASELVMQVGNVAVFFRPKPEPAPADE
jgi:RNA-binding protein